jgi:hypothetical protein
MTLDDYTRFWCNLVRRSFETAGLSVESVTVIQHSADRRMTKSRSSAPIEPSLFDAGERNPDNRHGDDR